MDRLLNQVPNACRPANALVTGGRPSPAALQSARDAGVRIVVDLCPASENPGFDEAEFVRALGLEYINLPIGSPADLTPEKARALASVIARASTGHPALVHCGSGNRVGALFALKSALVDGCDLETALAQGRAAGMTGLEPTVRQLIGAYL